MFPKYIQTNKESKIDEARAFHLKASLVMKGKVVIGMKGKVLIVMTGRYKGIPMTF